MLKNDQQDLLKWYRANKRELPWRSSSNPYRIWISEVMLQQTTVTAVIPFYKRFLERFPSVQDLSKASIEDVYQQWTGLGYYSRARNLHKAAVELAQNGFPKTWQELIQLPGFGPYTARAVVSLAFGQSTGVLDGNVIRILARRFGLATEWWLPKHRQELQNLSDQLVQNFDSSEMNQAMMELGATVCTPKSPLCNLCPWAKRCEARSQDRVSTLPLSKPRRASEFWVWEIDFHISQKKVALIQAHDLPFLKGKPVFPGRIRREKRKPTEYLVKHNITHHDIYVLLRNRPLSSGDGISWHKVEDLPKVNPSALLSKIITKVSASR